MQKKILSIAIGIAALSLPALLGAACSDDDAGVGTLEVTTWGEEYIEEGIPASALEDGWAIRYHAFVVSLGGVDAAGELVPGAWAVDLTRTGPHVLATEEVPAGDIAPLAYTIRPLGSSATNLNVDAALFAEMQNEGLSVYVEGTATKGASTIDFAWGFDVTASYYDCEAVERVAKGGMGTAELTIHGDHLLYESLVDAEAGLRFQALADADANSDGEVTPAELAAVSGNAFLALDHYDVPGGSGIDNLWDYLSAQVATLGHIDGEGHCHME